MGSRTDRLISLIVPAKDEEHSIRPFLAAVDAALSALPLRLEIVFIDDGSTDRTLQAIKKAAAQDERVVWVSFSRNFGKEIALSAGLDYVTGDAAVTIDVDLQQPPAMIPTFVELWQQGYKMVYGIRQVRRGQQSLLGRVASVLFYKAFNLMADIRIEPNSSDFRLMDRKVVDVLKSMPERTRFMKALYAWPGFSSLAVPYVSEPRAFGASRFHARKLLNLALDGIFSFSTWPLRIWGLIGLIISALSLLYGGVIIAQTLLFGVSAPGYPSLIVSILFLGGVQLLSIGILGEYVGRLFYESKRRPLYVVADSNGQPFVANMASRS